MGSEIYLLLFFKLVFVGLFLGYGAEGLLGFWTVYGTNSLLPNIAMGSALKGLFTPTRGSLKFKLIRYLTLFVANMT